MMGKRRSGTRSICREEQGMNRRTAFEVIGGVGAMLVLPAAPGCGKAAASDTTLALAPWSGPPTGEDDVRIRALSYAVLAPNAHNTQPWRVALGDDFIDLHVDATRLLPETDPPYRQTHVSQGTFLELLVIALAEHGRGSEVLYFPEGEYANDALDDRPVARVRISAAAVARDPLFAAITTRTSNKRVYESGHALPLADRDALSHAPAGSGVSVAIVDDAVARSRLADICTDAMVVEVRAARRNAETARWFRFSDAEIAEKRDGFGLAHAGVGGFKRWCAETFLLDRASASDPGGSFAGGAVDQTRAQAHSAAAFGALVSDGNSRRAQVVAGRAYARIALTAATRGLAMHPMSQALEEYPDMVSTKQRLEGELALAPGGTVQMLFRLGFAQTTSHTPRRDVRALLLPG
jgi:hypothetical protein